MLSLRPSSFLAPTEGGARSWVILLFLQTRSALERRTTRSVSTQNRCRWMAPVFERLQRRQQQDKPWLNLNTQSSTWCCSAEPPQTCKWTWYHIKAATLQLRWIGPKTCERCSPYKNADDGSQPSLCAATREADVSTKVGQGSLCWSRHTASTATTSCPRFCFMATSHRHRLDCFVFCDRSFQRKHRFATVFLGQRYSVRKTRSFF